MNKERLVYSVLSAIMFISGAALLVYYYWANGYIDMPVAQEISEEEVEYTNPSLPKTIVPTTTETAESEETTGESEETEPYKSKIDFDQLQKTNSEIIGWIQMTKPEISAPILMSESDDAYYLFHGPNGKYNKRGSFFIEKTFNAPEFDDPVTIIYGHRKSDGSMFGSLQKTLENIDISNDYRIHPRFKFFDDRYLRQYDDMIRPDETMLAINESNTEKVLLFTKTKYRLLLKETEPTIIINGYKIDADVEHYMKLLRRARDKAHTQELKAKAIGAKTNQFIMYKELTIDMLFNIDCKLVSKLYKSGEVIVKLVASKNKRKGIPIYNKRLVELPDSVVLAYDTSKGRFNIVLILNEGTPMSTFRMVPIRLINIGQSEMIQ